MNSKTFLGLWWRDVCAKAERADQPAAGAQQSSPGQAGAGGKGK
jgi:hypothetical protein